MRNDVIYLLVGYDPDTERVSYRQEIPRVKLGSVLSLVSPDADDPDALDSYPLDYSVAKDIMGYASMPFGDKAYEYFFESRASATA
jgi:hypothetical protein